MLVLYAKNDWKQRKKNVENLLEKFCDIANIISLNSKLLIRSNVETKVYANDKK